MISVRISSPLTQANVHELARLDKAVVSCVFTTAIFGGFTTATITLAAGWRTPVPAGAHVEIFWNGELVWEGQRRRPKKIGRDLRSLECVGYGTTLSDANWMQTAQLAGTNEILFQSNLCLQAAMAMAPLLSRGPIWGSPAVNHQLSIFDGMTLWAIATLLGNEAGFDWAVWEGRQANFTARVQPATADYLIAEDDVSSLEVDDSSVWTRVTVGYTDAITKAVNQLSTTAVSYAAEAQQGVVRAIRIPGGTLDAAGASSHAQTYLAQHINPQIAGSIGPYATLKQPFGGYTPGPMVRSGQWVQVQNIDLWLPIVQTSCNEAGLCTVTLGAQLWNLFGNLASLNIGINALKQGLNLVTGAKA